MRDAERLRSATHHAQRVDRAHAPALQSAREILALEPLHREPVAGFARAVRHVPDDRGVLQIAEQPDLLVEAPVVVDELERNRLARHAIARAKDRPHPARARFAFDLEALPDDVTRAHASSRVSHGAEPIVATGRHTPIAAPNHVFSLKTGPWARTDVAHSGHV